TRSYPWRYACRVPSGAIDIPFLNELLQPICGEPLTAMWRALGQGLDFGVQKPAVNRRGEAITKGEFLLKFITADWGIIQHGRIILGSSDYYDGKWSYESEEEPHMPYDAEARVMMREFLAAVNQGVFIAESVEVSDFAEVRVRLSKGLVIESFATT